MKTIRFSYWFFGLVFVLLISGLAGRAQASPTYALSVSTNSNRSNAIALQGSTLSGNVYVFTSYSANVQNQNPIGISQVAYWLDNPAATGTPTHVEHSTPYDFRGTANNLAYAYPWNTANVAAGNHTITQVVTLTNGASEVDSATFSVGGTSQPEVSAVPSSASFVNVLMGTSSTRTIKLSNTGTGKLTISQSSVTGSGFSSSGLALPLTLGPGSSTTLSVAFAPTSTGSISGNLALTSNAPNSPLNIPLSGTGATTTYLLTANPASLSFGSVNIGSTGSSSVTLTNSGNSNVTISSVTSSGAGFTTSGFSGATTLTPNQSLTLNVAFAPTTAGSVTGSIAVVSSATNSPAIALSGTGVSGSSGSGTTINVTSYGATGNGSTDDTAAINSAIAALQPGDTLLFPCTSNSTYLTSSQLTLNLSNITIDGSSCAIILSNSSGTVMAIGGSGNGNPNYGSAIALSSTANELATSFSTSSPLGVAAGDLILLQQGGQDSSTGSSDTGCDPSGCRGELLKVASVSGNTVTVTTALHDTYDPSLNGATAQKILSPLSAITIKNITFDGNGSNTYGLALAGVADSSLSGVTARNVQGAALLNRGDFNVSWTNISVTGAGSAQCGSAVWFEKQGNLSINGLSISNENQGASGTGCLYNGAFGFELQASANSTITNLSVDASGAYGRPFKTSAARYNTFNSTIVKNGVQAYNGISLEYYSSHNTYNNCIVTNNGAGTGTGTGNAGIITFGNFNQYNSFNNCTVSGNGNVQFYISGYDALRLAADSHNTISGGSFTGSNTTEAAILIEGDGMYITGATISGPGAQGIYLDTQASNACVNNNTFLGGTGLGSAISANGSNDLGLGNLLNLLLSNLIPGTCSPPLP